MLISHQPSFSFTKALLHVVPSSIFLRCIVNSSFAAALGLLGLVASPPLSACTANEMATGAVTVSTVNDKEGRGAKNHYSHYRGNGLVAAKWPANTQSAYFGALFTAETAAMDQSYADNNWGANHSSTETSNLRTAVEAVANASKSSWHRSALLEGGGHLHCSPFTAEFSVHNSVARQSNSPCRALRLLVMPQWHRNSTYKISMIAKTFNVERIIDSIETSPRQYSSRL